MTQFLERLINQWQLRYFTFALCCGLVFYAVVMPVDSTESAVVSAATVAGDQVHNKSLLRKTLPGTGTEQPTSSGVTSVSMELDSPLPGSGVWLQENRQAASLVQQYARRFEEKAPLRDTSDLVRYLRRRASLNEPVAQFLLGHAYQQGLGVPKNMSESVRLYALAEETRRRNGSGESPTPTDFNQALSAFQRAAEAGDPVAELYQGLAYSRGDDVARDDVRAVEWFRKAASHGSASAACDLGEMLLNGEGTAKDSLEAARWLTSAAARGSSTAVYLIGMMYRDGDGLPRSEVSAAKWLSRAAELGNTAAQVQLSEIYATGSGVQGDTATSYMWLNLASVTDRSLMECRNEYEKLMSESDRSQGQRLTHEWLQRHASDRHGLLN